MVSAFSLIFGLDLASHKFRAYVFGFGDPTGFLRKHTLYVHGPGWTPIEVHLNTEGPMKVLGVLLDSDLSGTSQLETTKIRLQKGLSALQNNLCLGQRLSWVH